MASSSVGKVEAGEFAEAEDEVAELVRAHVERGFEGLGFRAEHDAALALDDVAVARKARIRREMHGFPRLGAKVRSLSHSGTGGGFCGGRDPTHRNATAMNGVLRSKMV